MGFSLSGILSGAGTGAAIGTLVAPGIGTAIGAGLGALSGWAQSEAQMDQAEAQQAIINAQNQIAREQLEFEKLSREQAFKVSQPSLNEIAQIQGVTDQMASQLRQKERIVQRDEQLLNEIDPAIKAAANEAYNLIKGEESKVLDPIRKQRAEQRQTMENQLLARLGPGYRSSSAGILSLNDFDSETDALLTTAQLQTIGTLTNTVTGLSSARPNVAQTEVSFGQLYNQGASAILGSEDAQKRRQEQALLGSNVNYQNSIATAGSQFYGDLGKAQAESQNFGQLFDLGSQVAGYAIGSKLGQSKANIETKSTVPYSTGQNSSPDVVGGPQTLADIYQGRL